MLKAGRICCRASVPDDVVSAGFDDRFWTSAMTPAKVLFQDLGEDITEKKKSVRLDLLLFVSMAQRQQNPPKNSHEYRNYR